MADTNQKIALLEGSELFEGLDSSIRTYMAFTAFSRDYACRDVTSRIKQPVTLGATKTLTVLVLNP
jgi:hypothetical protein